MRKIYKMGLLLCLLLFIVIVISNLVIIIKSSYYLDDDVNYKNYDYVLVLGASAKNNKPSLMLKDRLDKVLEIYNSNNSIKIIVSGDSVSEGYSETNVMKDYLVENNVSLDNIIIDNFGVSTYDSIVRIKDLEKGKKGIIVTQKYHLYRSVFIALENDLDVIGVKCCNKKYFGNFKRNIREVLARVKDYFYVKFSVEARY